MLLTFLEHFDNIQPNDPQNQSLVYSSRPKPLINTKRGGGGGERNFSSVTNKNNTITYITDP